MGVCNCSMYCCTLLYVHSSIAIVLMRKRELVALLNLSSQCLAMVEPLFLAVPRGCLRFVIVVFPDYTHLLFFNITQRKEPAGKIASLKIRTGMTNIIILKKKLDKDCITTMNVFEGRLHHTNKSNGGILSSPKEMSWQGRSHHSK